MKSDTKNMESQHPRKVSFDELQNRQTDLYFNTKQSALDKSKLKQVALDDSKLKQFALGNSELKQVY